MDMQSGNSIDDRKQSNKTSAQAICSKHIIGLCNSPETMGPSSDSHFVVPQIESPYTEISEIIYLSYFKPGTKPSRLLVNHNHKTFDIVSKNN